MRSVMAGLMGLVLAMPAAAQPARSGETAGRYAVTSVAGSNGGPATVIMVDTATGQTWMLVQTPGPPIQWAPVRFLTPGNPATLTPLPPAPNAVGTRPVTGETAR
ncbi:hypothetical protein ACE7GA_16465 [Roseomonas sp. CCTCC AB2023176]|uniref:hypothetical protein n=1 Tax=Roseomonas sp. CCTCC AB2023176 TaxID=3342640 RepID=UPI0035DE90FD